MLRGQQTQHRGVGAQRKGARPHLAPGKISGVLIEQYPYVGERQNDAPGPETEWATVECSLSALSKGRARSCRDVPRGGGEGAQGAPTAGRGRPREGRGFL